MNKIKKMQIKEKNQDYYDMTYFQFWDEGTIKNIKKKKK